MKFKYWRDSQMKRIDPNQNYLTSEEVEKKYNSIFNTILKQSKKMPSVFENDDRQWMLSWDRLKMLQRNLPFKSPYYPAEKLHNTYSNRNAYIFLPGPSMRDVDFNLFNFYK